MTERPTFFAELQRRNVIRVAIAYIAVSWLVLQAGALIVQVLDLPNTVSKVLFVAIVVGFIPALVFSWVYELTPEGLKRESEIERHESITRLTGRKLDYIVIGVLGALVALLLVDKFVLSPKLAARAVADTAQSPAATDAAASGKTSGTASAAPGAIPEIEKDPSIAVLPMVNMSDDKANEFFSDGISEELLNLLAKVPELRVIARTSSFSFKGKDTPIVDIARVLSVASVLEGSVRKSGDKVRITVQLIRARDGSHLWSETYDRTLDDIFKVQDEIAAAVVSQLQVKLLGASPKAKPVDPRAYPLVLQAQALNDQASTESRNRAIEVVEQALAIAPNEARAWQVLGRIYFNQTIFGARDLAEGSRLAKEAANKALALDPSLAAVHSLLGRMALDLDLDLAGAARHLQRALELDPREMRAINTSAILLSNIGRMEEALPLVEYRVAHDPANPSAQFNLGNTYLQARRWDNAIAATRTALRLNPETAGAHANIGEALLLGKNDAAAALKECEAESDELSRATCLPVILHALGRGKEADAATDTLIAKFGAEQPNFVAGVQAYRGRPDVAFEWLDKAVAMRDPGLTQNLVDPLFDSLRGDARWLPFLRQIGYAPEQVAAIQFKVTLPPELAARKPDR